MSGQDVRNIGERPTGTFTTDQQGRAVPSDNHSLTVGGPDGVISLTDTYVVEKLAAFDRERVPERVVHAKGGGAFGELEITEDVSQYTRAAVFQPGTKTPMLARFSTVAGEQGSPDTWRDPRGFALKFYTTEGNLDIVGNNTPIFFVRDGIKFPDFIHSQKRLPGSGLRDHNMQWDFWTHHPESSHQVTYLMGDRGIPKNWRHMNGYGSHTYQWINAQGERFWVKYHFVSNQGVEGLTQEEADQLAGQDADAHRRDLYDAIERGEFPSWDVYVQVMPYEDGKTYKVNPFDVTKTISKKDYPRIKVGRFTLNQNPLNFFAQIEQAAFSPGNTVPGVAISPDKMLMTRVFSYPDTHRHRIGANFADLPVNYPHFAEQNSYSQDGPMRYTFKSPAVPVYAENSKGGPHADPARANEDMYWQSDGEMVRAAATVRGPEDDEKRQASELYSEVMSAEQQDMLVSNVAGHIGDVTDDGIRERAFQYWENINPELGSRVRQKWAESQG
ncbi:catalase [Kocuria sp. JC486]|uniref:catalase n=1 Tax=Kocuria sp. JC486 TaxID=1970736 RepID=UPI00141DB32F|nr:catalase [Kocuria sp. JC486]NHU84695.1 catalase [Kocuria sp. JC486]